MGYVYLRQEFVSQKKKKKKKKKKNINNNKCRACTLRFLSIITDHHTVPIASNALVKCNHAPPEYERPLTKVWPRRREKYLGFAL